MRPPARSLSPLDVENSIDGSPERPRARRQSRHQIDATNNAMEERADRDDRRARATARANARAQNRVAARTVEQAGDDNEVQQLRALLYAAEAERDAAERELLTVQAELDRDAPDIDDEPIPRPSRISNSSVRLLRHHMNLVGSEHDIEWIRMRSVIRDYLRAGRIQWGLRWKEQPTRRLSKIYDAIEDDLPVLRRFQNSWATEYLAKNSFNGHKTYERCKDDGSRYRGKVKRIYKNAVALHKRRVNLTIESDEPEEEEGTDLE
ncbi:hypothetical protein BD779DRAFT_1478287 [Infundibulicybe gibba]|nr:hypothetical protein BD779DRAFT_1478287 [Infundibulicybe gibba]